jgi:hypothetical protein
MLQGMFNVFAQTCDLRPMPNDILRMSNRLDTVLAAVVGTLVESKLEL